MSSSALVPNSVWAVRPGRASDRLATEPFLNRLQRRRFKLTYLKHPMVTALALAVLILAAALPRPILAAPGSWSSTGNMTIPRCYHTATLLPDGNVLVAGGNAGGNNILYSSELFYPANGWWGYTYNNMATARDTHTATLLPNGQVLVAGGESNNPGGNGPTANAELYDPAGKSWQSAPPMNTARSGHTATLLPNGQVLVAGGVAPSGNGSNATASSEIYDPAANSWTPTSGPMATARYSHTATLLPSGQVLVAGGEGIDTNFVANAELFNLSTGTWSSAGHNGTARSLHTATLLRNYGWVLVAGGWSKFYTDFLASVELFTVAGWQSGNSLVTKRDWHTATQLPNGQVLVAAGFNSIAGQYSPLQSAELYDSTQGTWSATGSLDTGRCLHTATQLSNGKVLVTGGQTNAAVTTASAEVYDPVPPPRVQLPPLLAFFPFDGNAKDYSGNGHHGTITGSPQIVAS